MRSAMSSFIPRSRWKIEVSGFVSMKAMGNPLDPKIRSAQCGRSYYSWEGKPARMPTAREIMGAYRDEMELALMMAGEAGKIILPHFRDAASLRVEMKADNSPVTIADRSAEEALRKLMDLHTPGYGIIGEEFGSAAGRTDREWVIDPIDGTKAFIHGVPLFGT